MISKVSGELTNFLKSKFLTYPFGTNYGKMKGMMSKAYGGIGDDYVSKVKNLTDDALMPSIEHKGYGANPLKWKKTFQHNRRVDRLLEQADPYEKMQLETILQSRKNYENDLWRYKFMSADDRDYKDFTKTLQKRRDNSLDAIDKVHNKVITDFTPQVKSIRTSYDKNFENVHKGYKAELANDLTMRKAQEQTRKDLITKQLDNMHDVEIKDLQHRADLRKELAKEPEYKGPMDWLARNRQPVAAGGATAAALGTAGWNLHNAMNEGIPSEYMYE